MALNLARGIARRPTRRPTRRLTWGADRFTNRLAR